MRSSPAAMTTLPGSEHMLNTVKFDGLQQPKTIAPTIRITMAIIVLTDSKGSTQGATVARGRRYFLVAEPLPRLDEMEPRGFEPLTPTMPLWCSTN